MRRAAPFRRRSKMGLLFVLAPARCIMCPARQPSGRLAGWLERARARRRRPLALYSNGWGAPNYGPKRRARSSGPALIKSCPLIRATSTSPSSYHSHSGRCRCCCCRCRLLLALRRPTSGKEARQGVQWLMADALLASQRAPGERARPPEEHRRADGSLSLSFRCSGRGQLVCRA